MLAVCGKDENKEKEAGNGPFLKRRQCKQTNEQALVH